MSSAASNPNGSCRSFLREFAEQLDNHRKGRPAAHARECESCQQRLERAAMVASELAERPPVPERLRQPEFLEDIYGQVVEQMAGRGTGDAAATGAPRPAETPLSKVLADIYQPLEVPDQAAWPLQELPGRLAEALPEVDSRPTAPSWLWQRTRAEVLRAVGDRAAPRGRFRITAIAGAAILLILSAGWYLAQMKGTSSGPRIVFVQVTEMPAVMHPSAVLRLGAVR